MKNYLLQLSFIIVAMLAHLFILGQDHGIGLRFNYSPWSRQELSVGGIIGRPSEHLLMEWPVGYSAIALNLGAGNYDHQKYSFLMIGCEYNEKYFSAKCSGRYTGFVTTEQYSVIPEVGITAMGLMSLTYGFEIPLTRSTISGLSQHHLNLNLTIPLYFW
jgi:hypothetical protein